MPRIETSGALPAGRPGPAAAVVAVDRGRWRRRPGPPRRARGPGSPPPKPPPPMRKPRPAATAAARSGRRGLEGLHDGRAVGQPGHDLGLRAVADPGGHRHVGLGLAIGAQDGDDLLAADGLDREARHEDRVVGPVGHDRGRRAHADEQRRVGAVEADGGGEARHARDLGADDAQRADLADGGLGAQGGGGDRRRLAHLELGDVGLGRLAGDLEVGEVHDLDLAGRGRAAAAGAARGARACPTPGRRP